MGQLASCSFWCCWWSVDLTVWTVPQRGRLESQQLLLTKFACYPYLCLSTLISDFFLGLCYSRLTSYFLLQRMTVSVGWGDTRIIGSLELEGTFKGQLVQLPCNEQGRSSLTLKVSRDRTSTTPPGNLFQCLTTLPVKDFPYIQPKYTFFKLER